MKIKGSSVAAEHVKYEKEMFDFSYKKILLLIKEKKEKTSEFSAYVEVFVIHARNLHEFFFENPQKDDIHYTHFCISKELEQLINEKKSFFNTEKANKQLCHLTYKRVKWEGAEKKSWDIGNIYRNLSHTYEVFVDSMSDERKNWFIKP
jgi:hypothetical protein